MNNIYSYDQDFISAADKYHELYRVLTKSVYGQDSAVFKFVQGCFQGDVFDTREAQPKSYFFFLGPSGTGKTFLAETAAKAMGLPYKIYDMSEYAADYSHEELIGTPGIYKNAAEGSLVRFVREHPTGVIIFDEFEKAHPRVIRLFLQILGQGRLKNMARNEDASFSDTIIIFTSNIGKELYGDTNADCSAVHLASIPEKKLLSAIRNEKDTQGNPLLPEAICSRIAAGNMVLFNQLGVNILSDIVENQFEQIAVCMRQKFECDITYGKELALLFLYHYGDITDARIASRQSDKFIKNEIYELTRQLKNQNRELHSINEIEFCIDLDGISDQLRALFVNEQKSQLLFLGKIGINTAFQAETEKYIVTFAESADEAVKALEGNIDAVFIDPYWGQNHADERLLSISDYDTEGIRFFHLIQEMQIDVPVYFLNSEDMMSEVDKNTFLIEGAADTIDLDFNHLDEFYSILDQIADECYMEKQNQSFCQRGWVLDYKTRQEILSDETHVRIVFYDLKKKLAADIKDSQSMLSDYDRPKVRFTDVIGAQNVKDELAVFIEYLKKPKEYLLGGKHAPKGVLLYGPPGTGKTLLARAMAGESDINFFQVNASDLKNSLVGESEANIRRLFAKARRYAPSIIFIDEIDAIGKCRTGRPQMQVTENMLTTLLTEMDGFVQNHKRPVFVLAATNYDVRNGRGEHALDAALIRRFDNQIYVDLPSQHERLQYLKLIKKNDALQVADQTLCNLAERTTGLSLAVLKNVFELATRNAVKQQVDVRDEVLLNALDEYLYGEKKEYLPAYYEQIAIHEAGHACMSYLLGRIPAFVSIVARNQFGGYTQQGGQEHIALYTKKELLEQIKICLAGRAAEMIILDAEKGINTGAADDLRKATEYAVKMLYQYGMESNRLAFVPDAVGAEGSCGKYDEKLLNELLSRQMEETIGMLLNEKNMIISVSQELIRKNHLTDVEFLELI